MGRLKLIVGGVIVLILGVVVFDGMFTVHQVQTALVLQFGKPVLPIHCKGSSTTRQRLFKTSGKSVVRSSTTLRCFITANAAMVTLATSVRMTSNSGQPDLFEPSTETGQNQRPDSRPREAYVREPTEADEGKNYVIDDYDERSALAVQTARDFGMRNAAHIMGGIDAWKKADAPLEG